MFDRIIYEIANIFRLFYSSLGNGEVFSSFLHDLGWRSTEEIPSVFKNLKDSITEIENVISNNEMDSIDFYSLSNNILSLFDDIKQIKNISISELQSISNIDEFRSIFPDQLINLLFIEYLFSEHPFLGNLFRVFGVISEKEIEATSERPAYTEQRLDWSSLLLFFKGPSEILRKNYLWGTSDFRVSLFQTDIGNTFASLGLDVYSEIIDKSISSTLNAEIIGDNEYYNKVLRLPFFQDRDSLIEKEIGIGLYPLCETINKKPGLAMFPYMLGELQNEIELTENLSFYLRGGIDISAAFAILLRPGSSPDFFSDLSLDSPAITSSFIEFEFIIDDEDEGKFILLGSEEKSRFEVDIISLRCGAKINSGEEDGLYLELELDKAAIVIQSSDGDGFLQKVLPKDPFTINFDLTLGISNKKGFYIDGGAGLEYTFQVNKKLGPVFLQTVDLAMYVNGEGITLDTAVTGGVEIGPVSASVQKIGLETFIDFDKKGNLGDADLAFGFKPPSGIAIAIDAGGLKGGGGLFIDKPVYAGVFELSYEDMFSINVFGLVVTEMPDGKDGYSMLFMILAEFSPVQLGLGFALKGVGGLIGIHRMMQETELQLVVKNHSIDHILFPKSPVKDFALILETVQKVFPPKEDHHVLGPMVKIIWGGSIDIIKFNVGLFMEFGGPFKMAILGQAKIELPNEKNALVSLNIDVLGFMDFGNGTLALDCSVYNSRILILDIFGDMALRAGGDYFAFSLGGFHPKFCPPKGFPALRRMTVMLSKGKAKAIFTNYLAFTSNTFQIGAKLELIVKSSGYKVTGGVSFDALFIFSPFSFDVSFTMWFSVYKGSRELLSIKVSLNLTGPNPFVAKGKAKVKILCVSVTIKVKATFGKKKPDPLPIVSPLADLKKALNDQRCISYEIPAWATDSMVFTEQAESYLDPLGSIVIKQKLVPLNFRMAKYGGGLPPASERILSFTYKLPDGSLAPVNNFSFVKEEFAPDQFKLMSDNERLTAPSFEKFDAGIRIENDFRTKNDKLDDLSVEPLFETVLRESQDYLDSLPPDSALLDYQQVDECFSLDQHPDMLFRFGYAGSMYRNSPLRKQKDESHPNYIKVKDPAFGITDQSAMNGQFNSTGSGSLSLNYSEAQNALDEDNTAEALIMDTAMMV